MKPSDSKTSAPIFVLAGLMAMAPFAIDAYLPAMPTMAEWFQVPIHEVELSLSLFLGGFAIGQLVGGPFSDHFGRRLSIITGVLLFMLGTAGILLSPTIEGVWLFRIIEALGGGLAVVNSPAVIRDLSSGKDSARHLSHMAVIMMMAPLLAPVIGMVLLHVSGWHGIFAFLFIYALFIGSMIFFRLPETRVKHPQKISALRRYGQVLKHRYALGYIFSQSFSYGGMFTFITASPLVYMGFFGVSETLYPFLFGANVVTMVVANRLNVNLLHRFHSSTLLSAGQFVQVGAGIILLAHIALAHAPSLAVVAACIMLFIGAQGLIVSNATANTVEFFPHNSATATALLGACGFLTGSLSGALVGAMGDGTPLPMAQVMCACAVAGPVMRFLLQMTPATQQA